MRDSCFVFLFLFVRGLDAERKQERQPYKKEDNWRAASMMRVQDDQEYFRNEPRQEEKYSIRWKMPQGQKYSKAEFQNATEQTMERDKIIKFVKAYVI